MSLNTENTKRLFIYGCIFVACLTGVVILSVLDPTNSLVENLKGALAMILATMLDVGRVAKKERDSVRPPKE